MAGLLNKLRMMDAAPAKAPATKSEAPAETGLYRREAVFPLSTFGDQSYATPETLRTVFGCEFPAAIAPEDVLFLDTETTGLSGGVGTIAFQVGLGYFAPAGFVVEQFLMRDYPDEEAMLDLLAARMKRFSVLCTFNGKTFDVPLLKTRFLMHRIRDDGIPICHADVLFPARRLWKLRLKQCNLGTLETALLGVEREDDLPGALVPQTYFQYLKDRNFTPLIGILDHNRQDIVSLAQLFYVLCVQFSHPEDIAEQEDLFSLARALEKQGQKEKAMKCYHLCEGGSFRAQATRAMAVHEKREAQPNCWRPCWNGATTLFSPTRRWQSSTSTSFGTRNRRCIMCVRPSCCWRNRSFIKTRLYKKSKMSYNIVMPVCGASSVRNLPRCDPPF